MLRKAPPGLSDATPLPVRRAPPPEAIGAAPAVRREPPPPVRQGRAIPPPEAADDGDWWVISVQLKTGETVYRYFIPWTKGKGLRAGGCFMWSTNSAIATRYKSEEEAKAGIEQVTGEFRDRCVAVQL